MYYFTKRTNCFITIAAAFFFLTCSAVFAEDSITVVSFGGAYTQSQIEAYHKPFTKKTGIKVNSVDYTGGIAQIRAQVEAGNVTWDVVDVETQDILAASDEGLLEVIDLSMVPSGTDGTPAKNDFIPNALHECGVGNIVWSNIIAYDKTRYPGKKAFHYSGFFRCQKIPGNAWNDKAA